MTAILTTGRLVIEHEEEEELDGHLCRHTDYYSARRL